MNTSIEDLLTRHSVILTDGHFVLKSGLHARTYVNKDALVPHVYATSAVCCAIATHFFHRCGNFIGAVIAPAVGGIALTQWTAFHLSELQGQEVLAIYAEKTADDGLIFKRGHDKLIKGLDVLSMEDVLTTGGTALKTIKAGRECGAHIIGQGALCNRGNVTTEMLGNVPRLFSLFNPNIETFEAGQCPCCKAGMGINIDVGHGADYVAKHGQPIAA